MNVGQLRELLEGISDETQVSCYMGKSAIGVGFMFEDACMGLSGLMKGYGENGKVEELFAILPHLHADDADEEKIKQESMN